MSKKRSSYYIEAFECPNCGVEVTARVKKGEVRKTTCHECGTKFFVEVDERGDTWSWPE